MKCARRVTLRSEAVPEWHTGDVVSGASRKRDPAAMIVGECECVELPDRAHDVGRQPGIDPLREESDRATARLAATAHAKP